MVVISGDQGAHRASEKFFEDVCEANADDPRSPPMSYNDQKELLKVKSGLKEIRFY